MAGYDVSVKNIEPMRIASVRRVIPTYMDMGPLFGEVGAYLETNHAKPGIWFARYHDAGYKERDIDAEVAAAISDPLPGDAKVQVSTLPAVTVASVVHKGSYEGLSRAYGAVTSWIEANGYHIAGPQREIYLSMDPGADPSTYVTEIQFPVAKS